MSSEGEITTVEVVKVGVDAGRAMVQVEEEKELCVREGEVNEAVIGEN